jgi:hypothetical protein
MLLDRSEMSTVDAVEHLVGMQAQAPNAPYVWLWTGLVGFRPESLAELVTSRAAVRTHLMRATVHLVTVGDCLSLRPVVQPVMDRAYQNSPFRKALSTSPSTVDPAELMAGGRALLAARPLSRVELGRQLAERWPDVNPTALSYTATSLVPAAQVPPRGVWGASGPPAWVSIE